MQLRIGIDVGGTFTHAVALDNSSLEIIEKAVTPTTHSAKEGVAAGVITVFNKLLSSLKTKGITADMCVFVAHSTTQATNALLEGDLSSVGILSIGSGLEGLKAKKDTDLPPVMVANGKQIQTQFIYTELNDNWEEAISVALKQMQQNGIGCIVAAEPFSVDHPEREERIKELAFDMHMPACGTHEISGLYGLRTRTRTTVINGALLPVMVKTAEMTEGALEKNEISAPLMVMRSDGGVMSISEMKRRPLMTLLSGPAAGIAAALTYIRATDAIFLETGGTSTDITAVSNGKAAVRSAVIGGHSLYMQTLDCRTLGVAGGSMVTISKNKIEGVGPRSAHIAGLPYVVFTPPEKFEGELNLQSIAPFAGDPEYLCVENSHGERFAVTMSCAANFSGYIKDGDYARGYFESVKKVFEFLAPKFDISPEQLAKKILELGIAPVISTVNELKKEYSLGEKRFKLIGGGGGSAAIVPFLAEKLSLPYEIAENAEVVSAIGAAMAMVRECIEKNIFSPTPSDIDKIKKEAHEKVVSMGADPESIEVHVEVDSQKNIVRAIATGSIEYRAQDLSVKETSLEQVLKSVAEYFSIPVESVKSVGRTCALHILDVTTEKKQLFGLIKHKEHIIAASDLKGSLKLQVKNGVLYPISISNLETRLKEILETHREYGDAGMIVKGGYLISGSVISDLTMIGDEQGILSLALKEHSGSDRDETLYYIAL